jgi:hypothetical protein
VVPPTVAEIGNKTAVKKIGYTLSFTNTPKKKKLQKQVLFFFWDWSTQLVNSISEKLRVSHNLIIKVS